MIPRVCECLVLLLVAEITALGLDSTRKIHERAVGLAQLRVLKNFRKVKHPIEVGPVDDPCLGKRRQLYDQEHHRAHGRPRTR